MTKFRQKLVGGVDSPCILVCCIEDGYCKGCKRTALEIRDWLSMSNEEQEKLKRELEKR